MSGVCFLMLDLSYLVAQRSRHIAKKAAREPEPGLRPIAEHPDLGGPAPVPRHEQIDMNCEPCATNQPSSVRQASSIEKSRIEHHASKIEHHASGIKHQTINVDAIKPY